MARLSDAVLKTNLYGNSLKPGEAALLNLTRGAQNGLHIQLGKLEGNLVKDQFCNAQPYTNRPFIPVLMQYPRAMDAYTSKDYLIHSLKNLTEARPSKITGINLKLGVDTASVQFGTFLEFEVATKTSYEKPNISMDYYEIKNKTIQRYWEFYIKNFVGNPFSQLLDAGTILPKEETEGIVTYDFSAFTMGFMEPDDLGQRLIDGCIAFNMWPKEAGDNEMVMDKAAEREPRNYSIPFAGTVLRTNLVNEYLAVIMAKIGERKIVPDDVIMPTANMVDPTIDSMAGGYIPEGPIA